jgi:hypothetical protein
VNQNKIKQKSGAMTPYCGAAPDAQSKTKKRLVPQVLVVERHLMQNSK